MNYACWAGVLLATSAVAGPPADRTWKPETLPREREIAAALSAGPASIAEGAGIYLLSETGFVLDRPSRNGFNCLVARDQPGGFAPQCLDSEGSETLLQVTLLETRLRMKGESEAAIARAVAEGYSSGRLKVPRRPGVNYMLSPDNLLVLDEKGTIGRYRPHVMIYAPYLSNADVGGDPNGGSPVFMLNERTPGAYLIVPVPPDAVQRPSSASR